MTGPADLEGRLLGGRYRLGRLLGRGGMGVVLEAHQEDLGRRVAIKLVHSDLAPDARAEALARFEREARSAAALGNPHIIQIFDFQAPAGESPFLVMELLSGETLAATLKRDGPLAAARAARIGVHVLSALAAAHQAGILHRDIKPGNVFLTTSPTLGEIAKVLDFGIAKLASGRQITQAGMVIGTALYMSPEQATGGDLDGRADLYSTAVTLYRALTGKSPFAATTADALLEAILSGAVIPLDSQRPDLHPGLVQIIARGMAPNRDQRFASAEEMGRALDHWLATSAVAVAPAPSAVMPLAPASLDHPPVSQAPASLGYPPVSQAPASLGYPPVSQAPASLGYPPTFAGPAPTAFIPQPGPANQPRRRGSKLLLVLLALGLIGGLALALGAGGYFAFQSGMFDEQAKVESRDGGAPGSDPTASATAVQVGEPIAVASGVAKSGTARSQRATDSDAAPAPAPSATAPAEPTAKSETPVVIPPVGLGAKCTVETDCSGNFACTGGVCACHEGQAQCGQGCFNLSLTSAHCGKCGNACPVGHMCLHGSCTDCNAQAGRAFCKGSCVNTQVDYNNCGMCGVKCPIGVPCWLGKCNKK